MEAIRKLREYANLKDDWYINSQLDLLEQEIKILKTKAQLEIVRELNQKNKI